jgi:hypothetical protein
MQQFCLIAGGQHGHRAPLVHKVNFPIGSGGGRFDFRAAIQAVFPEQLAGRWIHAGHRLAVAVHDIKPALIEQGSGNIGGYMLAIDLIATHPGAVGFGEEALTSCLPGINGSPFRGAGEDDAGITRAFR